MLTRESKKRKRGLLAQWVYGSLGYLAYKIMWMLSFPVLKLLFGLEVRNAHCIPKEGPIILAANHFSILDPWVLQMAFPRRITYMVGALFYQGKGAWFYKMHKAIPVKERGLNKDAFVAGLDVLKDSGVLGIFPEGWEERYDGQLQPGNPGVAMLSCKSHVPVLPAYISGANKILPKGSMLPRFTKITVTYGEPINFNGAERPDKETLRKMTDTIMEGIRKLNHEDNSKN